MMMLMITGGGKFPKKNPRIWRATRGSENSPGGSWHRAMAILALLPSSRIHARSGPVILERRPADADPPGDRPLVFPRRHTLAQFLDLRGLQDGGPTQVLALGLRSRDAFPLPFADHASLELRHCAHDRQHQLRGRRVVPGEAQV